MGVGQSPTVRQRRLAIELRRLRNDAALGLEDAGAHIERTAAAISRIENAQVGIGRREVASLLDLYGVTDTELREALLTIAREARQRGWWHKPGDVLLESFGVYGELESAASAIWTYQAQFVPRLLQTEAYARALLFAHQPATDPKEHYQQVAARMAGQIILDRETPIKLWLVLDEGALRRTVGGPDVMRAQLERLAEEAARPNATIQVLPLSASADLELRGSFTLLTFPEEPSDPPIVCLEHLGGGLYLDEVEDADRYQVAVSHLQAAALSPRDSAALIAAMAREE